MAQSINTYVAPITMGFTPAYGDLIRGTVNGVEVSGEWKSNGVLLLDSSKNQIGFVEFNGAQYILALNLPSAPTTDYELHLYRYTPEGIVQIPQRYVDGLEEITANANQALETATAAQNTANTAKSTADTAKSTANAIKPDWNEMSETSPKYVANRPCYYVHTETKSFRDIPTSQVLIEETQLYWYGEFADHRIAPAVDKDKKYRFEDETQIYTCKGYRTSGYVYYYIIGNAALVSDYLKLVSDGSGGPVSNTGEDWAYVTHGNSQTSSMFSKTMNYKHDKFLYKITENLKTLDPILIPSAIQRVGDDVIINSSTLGSTKKFKITVDDTGTISATEVT